MNGPYGRRAAGIVAKHLPEIADPGEVEVVTLPEMPRRDQRLLLALAALALALALAQTLTGLSSDVLLAVPALVLLLPLLAGRYVGEETLARLAVRFGARRRRAPTALASAISPPRVIARGSRLMAVSLAERGPPALRPLTS